MERPPLTASSEEKRTTLVKLLKEVPTLIVVDNLETVADYQTFVPYLRQLANPSKFLITTRFSLQSYSDIFCYSLSELEEADALAFLRHEAVARDITRLAETTPEQLAAIYQVVGGNPLALKLVGQLYNYIYWQAWVMLDDAGRQLFLSMPVMPNGTFSDLEMVSGLDADDLQEALSRLVDLSLVEIGGEADEPSYRLHRLTETFLTNEVVKWQLSN